MKERKEAHRGEYFI